MMRIIWLHMNIFNISVLIFSATAILFSILALWIAVRLRNRIRRLIKTTNKENLDEILTELMDHLKLSRREQDKIHERLNSYEKAAELHLQKVGMVRFNPFAETGSDQSFSLVLLDGQSNGFVISSLHNRDQTRMYIKAVAKGSGDSIKLSREERMAMDKALSK